MIKLSKRLSAVAAMVSKGCSLADVGTDHAYIPIYLTQEGRVRHAIAMDVNIGPLLRAEEHIENAGLTAYIETRLSDGLKNLTEGEADSVVIAGMGGALMMRILSEASALWNSLREVILQPQSELEEFRRYLYTHGFRIVQEDMVEEDGKYYPMMRCVPDRTVSSVCGKADETQTNKNEADEDYGMSTADYRYGALLLKEAHPVLKEFLQKEDTQLTTILASLNAQEATEAIAARRSEVEERRAVNYEARKMMSAVQ